MNNTVKTAKSAVVRIKEERQAIQSAFFNELKLFWAFSNEQFDEGLAKNGLDKTIKLVHIGGGGYMPKINIDAFNEGMKEQEKDYKNKMKEHKEELIKYELNNYECFYTGNIQDVVDLLKGFATEKQIQKVYNNLNTNI